MSLTFDWLAGRRSVYDNRNEPTRGIVVDEIIDA